MNTWLNVAEKPSVAKEVAHVLSGGQCRSTQTLSRFNPVFEFYFDGHAMVMTSVAGHLMEDEFPPRARGWSTVPFHELFTAKITKSIKPELEPVKRNIEALAKRADTLVLWLDCDREGENICFEVMSVALKVNPRLSTRRARFSALTQRDLMHAMRHLQVPDRRLSDAVDARQEMDLRIGAVFTRYQTVRFRDAFQGIPRILSFGPCQFPTLGFVVRRQWERQGFVAEDYFTLRMTHNGTVFRSSRGSIFSQVAATVVYDDMLAAAQESNGLCVVTHVTQRPNRRHPPVPLATVVLQKLAATHLHMTSERCMTLAESLYQEGLISYPRTETDAFSLQDSELLELVRIQAGNTEVAEFANAMLQDPSRRFRRPLRGGHDDKAHPPVHPTKAWLAGHDERGRLYTLIVRHYLACLSPDAVAATTSVVATYGDELFTTAGTTIVERGWLDVFVYESWHGSCIPNYAVGDRFVPSEVLLERHRTSPPPNLTETNLIALMDENGIGTDATIAQHIKTVLDREYVRREGQALIPTTLGIALASAYDALGLTSLLQPQLRAQMELAMGDIANGLATKEQVVGAAVRLYREIFNRLAASGTVFREELAKFLQPMLTSTSAADTRVMQAGFIPCGECGSQMALAERKEGERETWFVECAQCRVQYRVPNGRMNVLEVLSPPQRCALCPFTAMKVTSREKHTAYTICPRCFTNPPAVEDVEAVGEFRCFQCTADCPLAKGQESIAITRCVSCRENDLRLRSSSTGAYLACKGYPSCSMTVSLPRAAHVKPCPSQRCPVCRAVMISFDFRGFHGVPGLELVETVCVSCDSRLKDYITVKGYQPSSSHNNRPSNEGAAVYALPSIATSAAAGAAAGAPRAVMCGCGTPAKECVSRKPNSLGKHFLTCLNRRCSFFQWLE